MSELFLSQYLEFSSYCIVLSWSHGPCETTFYYCDFVLFKILYFLCEFNSRTCICCKLIFFAVNIITSLHALKPADGRGRLRRYADVGPGPGLWRLLSFNDCNGVTTHDVAERLLHLEQECGYTKPIEEKAGNTAGRPSSCAAKLCMTSVPLPSTRGNCGNPPLHYS
jgi:hypothetical protein